MNQVTVFAIEHDTRFLSEARRNRGLSLAAFNCVFA
jgi:hypothetical protein